MKKIFLFVAVVLGLVHYSYSQSSPAENNKTIKITIEEEVDGKTTTKVIEGEDAIRYLEGMDDDGFIDLEESMRNLEVEIEKGLEQLEKQIEKVKWEEYGEKIEIKVERITEEIERKVKDQKSK